MINSYLVIIGGKSTLAKAGYTKLAAIRNAAFRFLAPVKCVLQHVVVLC